jgi:hypothetical protein
MAKTTVLFGSRRTPEAALAAFEVLAGERGWRVLEQSETRIAARRPINWRTWGDRIEVVAVADGEAGCSVEVRVSSWQLVDWGAGRDIGAEIERRLA